MREIIMHHPHQKLSHALLLLGQHKRSSYALCSRQSAHTAEDSTDLAPSDPPPAPSAAQPEGSASLAAELLLISAALAPELLKTLAFLHRQIVVGQGEMVLN